MAQVYQVSFTPHVTYAADIRANSPEEAEAYVRQNWRETIVDSNGRENDKLVVFVAEEVSSDEDGYEFDAAARSIVNRHGDEFFVGDTVCPREDDCVCCTTQNTMRTLPTIRRTNSLSKPSMSARRSMNRR